MQYWLPIMGILVGFFIVYASQYTIPPYLGSYLSLATLAGLDCICGGIRASLEKKFHNDIFITGFLINTILASLLAYLGDRIGVDLFLAAVVTLGGRVFLNLSLIRRYILTRLAHIRAARKEALQATAANL